METYWYFGNISMAYNGLPCHLWSSQTYIKVTDEDFPLDGSIEDASNYCRIFGSYQYPFCVTRYPFNYKPGYGRSYCHVPVCKCKYSLLSLSKTE